MNGDPRIFISYSRQDGATAAAEIRERLAAEGLSLWQDLVAMDVGRDWWRQIEEAITKAEYLVLLLTPKALESEVVAKEWRYARQQGTYVIPVCDGPPGALQLDRLAGWMRRVDIVDRTVPERWTRLVAQLKQPAQIRRVPMMAEAPPSDFVPRPAEFAKLKAALLDPGTKDAVGITAALKGAGGYGKTTLARALCADPDIQDAYHDGVLWVTLGESPGDPLGRVEDLIAIVSGDRAGFANVEAASVRLEELLAERRMLVVIDDAWNATDTRPFLRGGPHCARLLTTRDSGTLPRGAAEQPVDQMRRVEAVALLRADLPPGEDEAFRSLAARLGEWPLLLRLANGALVDRVTRTRASLPDALAHVGRLLDKRGLTAFDAKNPQERHDAVGKTLALSLDRLDASERQRLTELAVFPEDAQVPVGTVELLWRETAGLDDIDTEDLLQRLYGLSLLLQLDLDRRFLQLHDVIRAWLCDRMGSDLAQVERSLVTAYRSVCDGEWHRLEDAYALTWLPMHLRSVDETAWCRLLLDPRWMAGKLAFPGVAALINDYAATDGELRLVGDTLRLSAHVLGRDSSQLAGQLVGRLGGSEAQGHKALIASTRTTLSGPSLLSRYPNLTAPGGPLLRTFAGHGSVVTAVALLPDGRRALSGSKDKTLKLWDLDRGAVLRTFEGHCDWVTTVALLPDGRRALSASSDTTLKLWDLDSGDVLHTFEGHGDWVAALACLSDGRRTLSASRDNTLKLWDLEHGAVLRTFRGHGDWVGALALLPDGHALSGSSDTTLRLWDLDSEDIPRTFRGHRDWVPPLALLPGRRVLSASEDKALRLWDLDSGAAFRTFEGHAKPMTDLALLPNGRRILTGSRDNTLRLWDLERGALLRTFEGHRDWVLALAILPDGHRALSGSRDNTLRLWDLERGALLRTFEGHRDWVLALAVLPDGHRALSGSADSTLKLWDLDSGDVVRTLEGHESVTALALLPDGRRALSGSRDSTLRLWDLDSGALLDMFEGHRDYIVALSVLPDGRRILSGSRDKTVRLWDLESGTVLRNFEGHRDRIVSLSLLPDGRQALSGSRDKSLRLWDLDSGAVLSTFGGHRDWVGALALWPDGRRALSGSRDKTLRLWDLESGTVLRNFEGHRDWVDTVALLPDGRRALSGSMDNTLRLWDLDSGAIVRNLEGHRDWVAAVTCLPDNRRALSCSSDTTLKLWDLDSGAVLRTFEGHAGAVTALALLPSGRRVLSGSEDKTLRLWDLDSGAVLRSFGGNSASVTAVASLRDGRRAISGFSDTTLKIWDLDSGIVLRTLHGHGGPVTSLACLSNGRRALSGSSDATLKLWDTECGECVATWTADQPVRCVAAVSDQFFLAGDAGGTLHFLDLVEPLPSPPERV